MNPRATAITLTLTLVLAVGAILWIRSLPPSSDAEPSDPVSVAAASVAEVDPLDARLDALQSAGSMYARFEQAAALAELDDSGMVAGLAERLAEPDSEATRFARQVLIDRLVALDLARAISLARHNDLPLRHPVADAIWAALGLADGHRTLFVAVTESTKLSSERSATLLRFLAAGDEATVLATLREADPASISTIERDRLRELILTDPAAALAELQAVSDKAERIRIGRDILAKYAETDPAAALDAALALGDPDDYNVSSVHNAILKTWFEADFAGALAKVSSPSFPLNKRHLNTIVTTIGAQNPDAAVGWIRDHIRDSGLRRRAISDLLGELGDRDPRAGAALFAKNPDLIRTNLNGAASSFTTRWVRKDAPAALEWAMAQTGSVRDAALSAYVSHMDGQSPEDVFALIESPSLDGSERQRLMRQASDLPKHDLPRYLALIDSLPTENSNATSILGDLANNMAQSGYFDDAIDIIESFGAGTEAVANHTQEVVAHLARSDPEAAKDWIVTFENPEARATGVRNLVDAWARTDPAAAASYALTLPTGSPERSQAALAMAERTIAHDPEGALAWFDTVTNPEERDQFLASHVTNLLSLAPDQLQSLAAGAGENVLTAIENEVAWRQYLQGGTTKP
ncbi:hypothetical protein BH23VER1_BH23VER1_04840 [soil metagenome]